MEQLDGEEPPEPVPRERRVADQLYAWHSEPVLPHGRPVLPGSEGRLAAPIVQRTRLTSLPSVP